MNIINTYFNFKKNNLVNYALLFCEKNIRKEAKTYLDSFMDTYIESYYYHLLKTYYDSVVLSFNKAIIVKEMKGKRLELLGENNLKKSGIINFCYEITFIAISMDLLNFNNCNTLDDFKNVLKENLYNNKENSETIDEMSNIVMENVMKEREFFNKININEFSISYTPYIKGNKRFLVGMDFNIEQLSKTHTKPVLLKNFHNKDIEKEKNKVMANLLNIDFLKKIINGEELYNYFMPIYLSNEYTEEEIKELIYSFDNHRIKNNITFLIDYDEYKINQEKFNDVDNYNFAILVNLSNVQDVEERLDEVSKFNLFRYVIIDKAKKEDYSLIDNYVMKGKEIFMNETNLV